MLGLADRLLFNLDYLCWSLARSLGLSVDSYCDLESVDGGTILVASDGSLASLLHVMGSRSMIGEQEFVVLKQRLAGFLGAQMDSGQHSVQFVFMRDPDPQGIRSEIQSACKGAFVAMQRLELELGELYQRKMDMLAEHYCSQETLLVALWTSPACLTRVERRQFRQERGKQAAMCPNAAFAPDLREAGSAIRDVHHSFVLSMLQELQEGGIAAELLDVHAALCASRLLLAPESTGNGWMPCLPGDPLPVRVTQCDHAGDLSALLWPTIASQLFAQDMELVDARTVKIGERVYCGLSMELGPRSVVPFNVFFRRLLNEKMPWLLSLRLSADGYGQVAHKMLVASLLSFMRTPRLVRRSLEMLQAEMERGGVCVGLQMQFCTWARPDAMRQLRERVAKLSRAVQSWGGIEPRFHEGNPAAALAASMPLLRLRSSANPSAAPISDVVGLLPVTRPASPWRCGSFLLRTPDGKLYPYEPCSSAQKAWVSLIFAPMGSGKSVLMNSLNTALVLAADNRELPRIGILDIGMSSVGMISLIREALPSHRRSEVTCVRLQNVRSFAINPFDTPLGCRFPLPSHKAFLGNFLTLLATPTGEEHPYEAVPNIAVMVIEEAYRAMADDGRMPKPYQAGMDPAVDALLDVHGYQCDSQSIWWEVVDFLFGRGECHGAAMAQRYAVPNLAEVAALARDSAVSAFYTGTVPMGREPVAEYFYRAISDAIRKYPILGGASSFSTDARIISLDLEEVAPRGGPDADRQTAVMYMLGRHVICGDIYLRKQHLCEMPERYRDWHRQRIEAIENTTKRLCFDEFHRTETVASVRRQIMLDIREGRKWKVEIILASQRLQDFDEAMIDLATTVFILGCGTQSLQQTVDTFRLPDAARQMLEHLGNPGREGSRLIAWFDTAAGKFSHLLSNTLSAEEIWAYSTTREDISVREWLYARMLPATARHLLALRYPAGTIKPEYERRLALLREQQETLSERADADLIRCIAQEVLDMAPAAGTGSSIARLQDGC